MDIHQAVQSDTFPNPFRNADQHSTFGFFVTKRKIDDKQEGCCCDTNLDSKSPLGSPTPAPPDLEVADDKTLEGLEHPIHAAVTLLA